MLFAEEGAKVVVTDLDAGKKESRGKQDNLNVLSVLTAKSNSVAAAIKLIGGSAISVPGTSIK